MKATSDISSEVLELKKINKNLQEKNAKLEHELTELKRMIFGSRSERFIPTGTSQTSLFDTQQQEVNTEEPKHEDITYRRKKSKGQPKRTDIPAHLPRTEEVVEPTDLPEGSVKIGKEITEKLEYTPGKVYVRRIVRPKYALPEKQGVTVAELPTQTLPKSMAGSSLLAYLFVSKFIDHLPFYRQVQIFKREGVKLSESTVNGWLKQTCDLLEPLYNKLRQELLKQTYLQADESPIKVLASDKPKSTHTGYHWVYHSPEQKLAVFDYRKSRSTAGPKDFLENFSGHLQTDGYKAYNNLRENQSETITLLACMAHARRYFDKALDNDKSRAEYALKLIQKLYAIEREIKTEELKDQHIKTIRLEEATPLLNEFKQWLDKTILEVTPKSPIGKAVAYTLNLWPRLIRYIDDARFIMDNNLIENLIRPLAIGRKNYLFAGSHNGAKRAAMMYSFFATCKLNKVNPFDWLNHTLSVIPDHKANRLDELLPHNWKAKS